MPPLVLAIDIGTSSTRTAIFDAGARVLRGTAAREQYRVATDSTGAATLDADRVARAVIRSIDRTLAGARRPAAVARGRGAGIEAVGSAAFWHSLVGLDARDRPTTPVITWADTRPRDAARELARELDDARVHARTGCHIHASYLPAKLRWIRDTDHATFRRTVRWCSFAEYLALRLSGERRSAHGMASATGLYDQARRTWDARMVDAAGIAHDALFPVGDEPLAPLRAPFARRWPQLARAAWLPAVGDGAAANVGSGAIGGRTAALSLGTSGAVRACFAAERARGGRELFEYRLDERYVVLGGAVSNAGNVADWSAATLAAPARRTPAPSDGIDGGDGRAGLTVFPAFAGERSPSWNADATAAIAGLRLSTSAGDIASALLTASVLRLVSVVDTLFAARPTLREIVVSGGLAASQPEVAQLIADASGRPVALVDADATLRGAAVVALHRALGGALAVPARAVRRYAPRRRERARYRDAMERQERLYRALRAGGF